MAVVPARKQILIVEDHPLFRVMLVQLVGQEPDLAVCGEADNTREAMQLVDKLQPDAAIVDLTLKGTSGLEWLKDLKARGQMLPVLVVSMHAEQLYAERALCAGAKGYVTKQASPAAVLAALRQVLAEPK